MTLFTQPVLQRRNAHIEEQRGKLIQHTSMAVQPRRGMLMGVLKQPQSSTSAAEENDRSGPGKIHGRYTRNARKQQRKLVHVLPAQVHGMIGWDLAAGTPCHR